MAEDITNPQNPQTETQPVVVTDPVPAPTPASTPQLRTFTQEQLDAIIARERTKATKGLFTADQMAAKDTSISNLTTERDNAQAENARLQAELDGLKNEKFLVSKGVPADMVDFYAFKIGKLVTDKKNFEQAADEYLKENPPANVVKVSTGGGVGGNGGGQPTKPNDIMNAIFRSAAK